MTGSGKLVAVAVGINSVQGRIFAAVQGKAEGDGGGGGDGAKDAEADGVASPEDVDAGVDAGDDGEGGNLEEKMDGLAMDIGKAGLYVSTVAFVIMTCVFVSMPAKNLDGKGGLKIFGSIMRFFLVAVATRAELTSPPRVGPMRPRRGRSAASRSSGRRSHKGRFGSTAPEPHGTALPAPRRSRRRRPRFFSRLARAPP